MMRHLLRLCAPVCLFFVAAAGIASAQLPVPSKWGDHTSMRGLTVGPYLAFGPTLTVGAPNSLKVNPRLTYRLGADASYPLTPVIAATFALGLDSRATEMYQYDNEDFYEIVRVNYFSLTPGFSFRSFWLGLNMGIPVGGKRTLAINGESTEMELDFDEHSPFFSQAPFERDTAGLAFPLEPNFMLSPSIGARIPITESELGWLGIEVSISYTLNELFERSSEHPGDNSADYHMPAIHAGVFYKFGIPGTQHPAGE